MAKKYPDEGDWTVSSISDPRWNMTGHEPEPPDPDDPGLVPPLDHEKGMGYWVKICKEKYGEPPKDCLFQKICYF